jgi:hypothetical protein
MSTYSSSSTVAGKYLKKKDQVFRLEAMKEYGGQRYSG